MHGWFRGAAATAAVGAFAAVFWSAGGQGARAVGPYCFSNSSPVRIYSSVGEQPCVVPPAMPEQNFPSLGPLPLDGILVDAIGASGGSAAGEEHGHGSPGEVTATIAATANEQLYVEVGGAGGNADSSICPGNGICGEGGFNGGAPSISFVQGSNTGGAPVPQSGGGGGGASDVRTLPMSDSGSPGSRLVVAGGAGGDGGLEAPDGQAGQEGNGGNAGGNGSNGQSAHNQAQGGFGGYGGSEGGPGAGGPGGNNMGVIGQSEPPMNGAGGDLLHSTVGNGGVGGGTYTIACAPYADSGAGGGGGGGYHGGGGGGGGGVTYNCPNQPGNGQGQPQDAGSGGGGGGGSSYAPGGSIRLAPADTGTGKVILIALYDFAAFRHNAKLQAGDALHTWRDNEVLACQQVSSVLQTLIGLNFGQDCVARVTNEYGEMVSKIDPTDNNFAAVALPRAVARPPLPKCRHLHGVRLKRCKAAASAFRAYLAASEATANIQAAIDTTLNRGNTAQSRRATADATLQSFALQVYFGEQQSAYQTLNAAGARLARALRAEHADVRVTAAQMAAEKRVLQRGALPRAVLAQLARFGISKAALRAVFKSAFKGFRPRATSLTTLLRRPLPSLHVAAGTLGAPELPILAAGLQAAKSLTSGQVNFLTADTQSYEVAATPAQQAAAHGRLAADARAIGGPAGQFLAAAVTELA
jgi:hypothetical protein